MFVAGAVPLGPSRHRPWWFQLWGLRRELEALAASDPAFQVEAPGHGRLCPYCLAATGNGRPGEDPATLLVEHILHDCQDFSGLHTPTRPAALLVQARERLLVRERIRTRSFWRTTDEHGFWVCPFCARSTPVYFCRDMQGDDELAAAVQEHLAHCEAYGRRRGALEGDDLWARVQETEREERLGQQVRQRLIAGDGFFDRATAAGDWVCPCCLQAQAGLRIDGRMARQAPARIARHLLHDCPAFRERPATRSRREIQERVRELDALAGPVPLPAQSARAARSA